MTAGLLLAAVLAAQPAAGEPPAMTHKIVGAGVELALSPVSRTIQGKAKLRLKPREPQAHAPGTAVLHLDPGFTISRVTLDDRPGKFQRLGDTLVVPLPKPSRAGAGWVVGVEYAGRPAAPTGGGRLDPDGAVMPTGAAAWLPTAADEPLRATTTVTVRAPKAWRVVGPAARTTVEPRRQAVRLDFPGGAPAFVAGPYKGFNVAGTTFYALGAAPADASAATAVTAFYKARGLQLGGAGRKAASAPTVVELAPGDPPIVARGWVAGPRPPGGLGAWLATSAWRPAGEAKAADRDRRWLVESLAAYTEELALGAASRPQRERAMRTHLADYQAFLRKRPAQDRALDAPLGPADPAWTPVVQDKGALVWGLVHEALGDDAFFALLRKHQAALQAGTGNLASLLAAAGPRVAWLESWLRSPGLPAVKLADVSITERDGRWQVTGALSQDQAFFSFPIDLALVTETGVEQVAFTTFAPRVPFHFVASARPLRLVLDGADRAPVVRRPHLAIPEGVAPADGVIVYGTQGDPLDNQASKEAAEALRARLARFKGLELPVRADRELTVAERGRSLILMGRPGVNGVAAELADQFPVRFARGEAADSGGETVLDGKALWWQGRTYTQPDQGVVQVIANPQAPEKVVLLFAGLSPRAQADALRFTQRLATFCVFAGDRVVEEGDALRPFPDLDVVLY